MTHSPAPATERPQLIGLLGIGLVGRAVASLLLAAGYDVVGYAPSEGSRNALQELGGRPVGSVEEVARAAGLVVLAVFNTEQVEAVVEGEGGLLAVAAATGASRVIVNLSTCEPDRIMALGERVRGRATLVEMPISGTSGQIAKGDGVGLIGGEPAAIASVDALLAVICPRHYRLGDVGAGAKAKLAVNMILGLNRAAMAEGIAFAQKLGLDARAFLEVARNSAAYSAVMDVKGRKMVEADYKPLSKVSQTLKDFLIMRDYARDAGQALPFSAVYIAMMENCMQAGEGDWDNAVLIDAIRRQPVAADMRREAELMNTPLEPALTDLADPIRIRRVEAIRVALPLAKPMLMAGVRIATADNVLVRIEAADGSVGWGEATSAPTMTGDLAESLLGAVRHLAPLLVDQDARMHAVLARRCLHAMHGNGGAKSAIDMALLDLVGRRMGVPLVELLGGALRATALPMWLLGNPSVADDIAEARRKRAEGFGFFKLKVGIKPIAEEIAAAALLRRELGDDVILCADANAGLDLARARQFVRQAGGLGLIYLEQPVRAEDLSGMQALAAIGTVPICADEGIAGAAEVLAHHRARAMSGINLKLMKAGGPRAAMRVAALCEALGLSITVAGKIAESSISAANTLAVACAAPNVDWGLNLTHIYLAEDLVRSPIRLAQGGFVRPPGPGNGIEVDESRVARYRVA